MYAIVKTGGKQYKVVCGEFLSVEKLPAEVGDDVELQAICIVDGDTIVADPAEAAKTKVVAEVLDQYKGKKQLVFKFKKRKGYKKLNGHRQQLTKIRIIQIGEETAERTDFAALEAQAEEIEEVAVESFEDLAADLVEAVEEAEEVVEEAPEAVEEIVEEVVEEAEEAVEAVEEVAEEAVEEAAEKAAEEE